ncbi:50S ribosomal protein L18 [Candidatus Saccharibacteria bacterium]|nr:50S ribosomal protein L18 [Candidatus Saccharibacteria bacterium]NIV03757.1 50S ribosomal protein L18 [Calditrichia bacterium]NIS38274.1 50S ribosomal protein L18 [Candidatus Saccharibacteria bacterium]NIV72054.1 50S ribosomal protein L18 [Calditrichia bacterium]NIV98902.1 50S ribosomal protein L18 [Candidatus Saccharibacteria bacterium]
MKDSIKQKRAKAVRRKHRIRAKIHGTKVRPRLCVTKTLNHIYAQVIDDDSGKTIAAASDMKIKKKKGAGKLEVAQEVGKLVAKAAVEKKVKKVIFDRSGYKYHGRIKALAEAAREAGLEF